MMWSLRLKCIVAYFAYFTIFHLQVHIWPFLIQYKFYKYFIKNNIILNRFLWLEILLFRRIWKKANRRPLFSFSTNYWICSGHEVWNTTKRFYLLPHLTWLTIQNLYTKIIHVLCLEHTGFTELLKKLEISIKTLFLRHRHVFKH